MRVGEVSACSHARVAEYDRCIVGGAEHARRPLEFVGEQTDLSKPKGPARCRQSPPLVIQVFGGVERIGRLLATLGICRALPRLGQRLEPKVAHERAITGVGSKRLHAEVIQ